METLTKDVEYWQECYESLLEEYFKDDQRRRSLNYYKGEIIDYALLNKVDRLAAESHLLLKDKPIVDAIGVKRVKPLAPERGRLTRRVRQMSICYNESAAVERGGRGRC